MVKHLVRMIIGCFSLCIMFAFFVMTVSAQETAEMKTLLPDVSGWELVEEPQFYFPESLFEYINGAAEIYISYDFQKLAVAQYEEEESSSNISLEIYDMGSPVTAFGIYSAERFPDNQFIDIGSQGYIEEGTLNFLAGSYYIKMLCFDCGENWDTYLKDFARRIDSAIDADPGFPAPVKAFPEKNLVPNSQKFILKNFMGYSYLHDGYQADYEAGENEFTAFIIEGQSELDAEQMLEQYLESKKDQKTDKGDFGYHIKDRYYKNIYITQAGNFLCGVMKIQDGNEDTGISFLEQLAANVKSLNSES